MEKVLGRKVALEGEEDRGDRFDGIVPCERGDSPFSKVSRFIVERTFFGSGSKPSLLIGGKP